MYIGPHVKLSIVAPATIGDLALVISTPIHPGTYLRPASNGDPAIIRACTVYCYNSGTKINHMFSTCFSSVQFSYQIHWFKTEMTDMGKWIMILMSDFRTARDFQNVAPYSFSIYIFMDLKPTDRLYSQWKLAITNMRITNSIGITNTLLGPHKSEK